MVITLKHTQNLNLVKYANPLLNVCFDEMRLKEVF